MKEVWAGSLSLAHGRKTDAQQAQVPSIVRWWWALFLISAFLDNASGRLMLRAEELDELLTSAYLMAFADLFNLPAAFVALQLVSRLTVLQAEHARSRIRNAEHRVNAAQQAVAAAVQQRVSIDPWCCSGGGHRAPALAVSDVGRS